MSRSCVHFPSGKDYNPSPQAWTPKNGGGPVCVVFLTFNTTDRSIFCWGNAGGAHERHHPDVPVFLYFVGTHQASPFSAQNLPSPQPIKRTVLVMNVVLRRTGRIAPPSCDNVTKSIRHLRLCLFFFRRSRHLPMIDLVRVREDWYFLSLGNFLAPGMHDVPYLQFVKQQSSNINGG